MRFASPSHHAATLAAALLLFFSASACDSNGGGEEDTTPPSAPSALAGASEDGAVALEWSASSDDDLDGYRVYRSTSSFSHAGAARRVSGDGLVSGTSYTDGGAANGTTYFYRVSAVDESDNESGLSGEAQKTPFPDPLDEP
jgi:TolB protein